MRRLRRIATLGGLTALLTWAGALAAQPASAITLDGAWHGAGHAMQISGTLEGGFSISAGESWSIIGCPIAAGTRLTSYSPKGGSSYDANYLWTESENGVCSNSYRGPEAVTVTGDGNTLEISGCGYALCGGFTRDPAPPSPTPVPPATPGTPPTTSPPTVKPDTSPPRVRAFYKEERTYPGRPTNLQYSVSDDSRGATVHLTLYQGGTPVTTVSRHATADGKRRSWRVVLPAGLIGPMYYCVWAQDAAGNRSARAPLSKCGWMSLLTPVAAVSNGCGGGGWDALVAVQNYFGNEHSYQQRPGRNFTVNFKAACDLHDAGYGGHTVKDTINGGIIDFRKWTRRQVDDKFLNDMLTLCREAIPRWAKNARAKCESRGGTLSIGARALYDFVHEYGWNFFDADLTTPGTQTKAKYGRWQFL